MTRLDTSALLARPGFDRLAQALEMHAGQTRLVGGAVRDGLLGEELADIDLATRFHPEDVLTRLQAADVHAVPTGLAHGTVTAILDRTPYEITTLREDVEHFGRHATVRFTDDWQADAARRDFTINALYADPHSGQVFDYFSGLPDLQARLVRFIGDPLQRIAEDHLRILRFFRFSARFARQIDPAGLEACTRRANDLMALSRERIRDELLKLLQLPAPQATVEIMLQAGIFQPVLPEIQVDALPALQQLIAAEAKIGVPGDCLRRLAALLPADAALAKNIARRLRLSRTSGARLALAADRQPVPDNPLALAYAIGAEATLDRMLLMADPRTAQWVQPLTEYVRPVLPLSGRNLIALGLTPGPDVSRILRQIEDHWLQGGFAADRAQLLHHAEQLITRNDSRNLANG